MNIYNSIVLCYPLYIDQEVHKNQIHILCSITFSQKSRRLWVNVEKYGRAGQATAHALYMLDN